MVNSIAMGSTFCVLPIAIDNTLAEVVIDLSAKRTKKGSFLFTLVVASQTYATSIPLSHLTSKVGLGALVRGVGEHCGSIAILNQLTEVHKHRL